MIRICIRIILLSILYLKEKHAFCSRIHIAFSHASKPKKFNITLALYPSIPERSLYLTQNQNFWIETYKLAYFENFAIFFSKIFLIAFLNVELWLVRNEIRCVARELEIFKIFFSVSEKLDLSFGIWYSRGMFFWKCWNVSKWEKVQLDRNGSGLPTSI